MLKQPTVCRDASVTAQAVLDALPYSVALLDAAGVIQAVNRAWKAFARRNGYGGHDFFVGQSYFGVCGAAEDDELQDGHSPMSGIRAVLQGQLKEFSYKYCCHSTTEERWFRLIASPLRMFDGRGALIMHVNITKEHRDQELLAQSLQSTRRRQRLRDQYFAGVNHDLRTPINAVLGYIDMLLSGLADGSPEKARVYLQSGRQAAKQMLDTVDSLLVLAKQDANLYELTEGKIDVRALAANCMDSVRQRAATRGIDLYLELDPGLPSLRADQNMVIRMIDNLLSNAVKYAGSGASVTLRLWADDQGYGIAVQDTGVGMPPESIDSLLMPYVQAIGGRSDGVGIGLALVRSMIDAHGGTLEVRSEPGLGTEVFLRFPKERVVMDQSA